MQRVYANYLKDPGLWVLEYSFSQRAVNILRMEEMIRNNLKSFFHNKVSDWIVLGVFSNYEVTDKAAEYIKEQLERQLCGLDISYECEPMNNKSDDIEK